MLVVVATVEVGVGQDRLARDLVEGDVLRGELGRRGDHRGVADPLGVLQGPRQRLHAAEAAADDGGEALDAEAVGEAGLGVDPVFHGDEGEVRSPQLAGGRIDLVGAGGAEAAAEIVHPDDEEAAGVERLARANQVVPPADVAGIVGVVAGDVVRARQRVAHQHRVAACGVERAVGLVDELVARQGFAAAKAQRLVEMRQLRRDDSDGLGLDHDRQAETKNPAGSKRGLGRPRFSRIC